MSLCQSDTVKCRNAGTPDRQHDSAHTFTHRRPLWLSAGPGDSRHPPQHLSQRRRRRRPFAISSRSSGGARRRHRLSAAATAARQRQHTALATWCRPQGWTQTVRRPATRLRSPFVTTESGGGGGVDGGTEVPTGSADSFSCRHWLSRWPQSSTDRTAARRPLQSRHHGSHRVKSYPIWDERQPSNLQ